LQIRFNHGLIAWGLREDNAVMMISRGLVYATHFCITLAIMAMMPSLATACKMAPPPPPPIRLANESDAQYQSRVTAQIVQRERDADAERKRYDLIDQREKWRSAAQVFVVEVTQTGFNGQQSGWDRVSTATVAPQRWIKGQGRALPIRLIDQLTSCGPMGPVGNSRVGGQMLIFAPAGPLTQDRFLKIMPLDNVQDAEILRALRRGQSPRRR
jgi:hypothetical protein